MINPIKPT